MSNNKLLTSSVMALSLSAMASYGSACDRPDKPTVPNGAEADMEQMIAGQTAVKEFVAAGNTFIECLEAEEKATSAGADKDDANAVAAAEAANAERVKVHNAVVDEMTTIAGEWKESMTAYKEKAAES